MSSAKNPSIAERIYELYVTKGFSSRAVAAAVKVPESEVAQHVVAHELDAQRELYLAENPNISAKVANQRQLASILNKQQDGQELTAGELAFLTKLADLQIKEQDSDKDDYYGLSKEELDERIKKLYRTVYGETARLVAPKPRPKT